MGGSFRTAPVEPERSYIKARRIGLGFWLLLVISELFALRMLVFAFNFVMLSANKGDQKNH